MPAGFYLTLNHNSSKKFYTGDKIFIPIDAINVFLSLGNDNAPPDPDGMEWYSGTDQIAVNTLEVQIPRVATTINLSLFKQGSNLLSNILDFERDENGFYYSRIAELNNILAANKAALIPCDQLNNIIAYGSMYQNTAQHQVPQSIMDDIATLNQLRPSGTCQGCGPFFTPLEVQTLGDATGTVVNTDFFPVKITQLPTGMTQSSLLEYFRLHLNDFTHDPDDVSNLDSHIATFQPYREDYTAVDGSTVTYFEDETKFNSAGANSIGSFIHINMADNGTVVESGYTDNFTPNAESHTFTFSTMKSPLDDDHPVSGNRNFGIYNYVGSDPARQGEMTFYIMGVDRVSDNWFGTFNSIFDNAIFNGGEKLWKSVQTNFMKYINDNGGQATQYSNQQYSARLDWKDVKDFLLGKIDAVTLKAKLGC